MWVAAEWEIREVESSVGRAVGSDLVAPRESLESVRNLHVDEKRGVQRAARRESLVERGIQSLQCQVVDERRGIDDDHGGMGPRISRIVSAATPGWIPPCRARARAPTSATVICRAASINSLRRYSDIDIPAAAARERSIA